DVQQVLLELSQKAGVPFDIEAGAVQQISPEARNIRLVLDDYSIQDALESICGVTGLDYMIRDQGVYLWNQAAGPNHRVAIQDRVLIMMPIRGTDMTVLITESQVPADVKEYIKSKQAKQLDSIREMMKEEGFKPTTQPATGSPAKKAPGEDL